MHRLFIALRPPEPLRQLLADATGDGPPGVRWQDEKQFHLTLRFVGEVERPMAEDLAAALAAARLPKVAFALKGVGRFDDVRRGVLWAGVTPREPLKALHDKTDRACHSAGVVPDRRAFHPHITLGRWSGGPIDATDWLLRHANLTSPTVEISHAILFESELGRHGAHHEEIARYPLG